MPVSYANPLFFFYVFLFGFVMFLVQAFEALTACIRLSLNIMFCEDNSDDFVLVFNLVLLIFFLRIFF
jgi:hypothetical protein